MESHIETETIVAKMRAIQTQEPSQSDLQPAQHEQYSEHYNELQGELQDQIRNEHRSEHIYTLLCHLAAPVVWPWKRKESEAVDAHGKAALNHMITCATIFLAVNVVLWLATRLSLVSENVRTFSTLGIVLVSVGCSLWATLKADAGVLIKYPLSLRWIK